MAHQKKEVRKAIEYAKENGWVYDEGGKSHKKGTLYCPTRECRVFVHGTPANPGNHAKDIKRAVDRCNCAGDEGHE